MICRTALFVLLSTNALPQCSKAVDEIALRTPADEWRENEARLGAVELTYRGLHTSTATARKHSLRLNLGEGREIKMLPSQYESNAIVASCPECSVIKSTSNEFTDAINYFDGQDWIEYRLDLNRKIKRRFDQLAGQMPHDPRWEFTKFNNLSPSSLLLEASTDETKRYATYIPQSQINELRHNEVRLELSSEFGGLPIASSLWMVDLSKQVETKLSDSTLHYCRIENRDAYVPNVIEIRIFNDGVVCSKIEYKLEQFELLDGERASVIARLPEVSRQDDLTKN